MDYQLKQIKKTIDAAHFIERYRDVERICSLCAQCPSFGNVWSCPPFDFDPKTVSDGFKTVTLLATVIEFDDRTRAAITSPEQAREFASRAMHEVWDTLLPQMHELERQLPGSRCFTFRCQLCPEGCTRPQGLPCRHPDRMRHSLESVGFDLSAAARDELGIDLEWSNDGMLAKRITLLTAVMRP